MQKTAFAVWQGGIKEGHGAVTTESMVLSDVPYSFGTRFENAPGANPEELLAAAHSACFSMALSSILEKRGISPNSVTASANVVIDMTSDGWSITEIQLDVLVDAPILSSQFLQIAAIAAKNTCPISRVLNTKITLNARLKKHAA